MRIGFTGTRETVTVRQVDTFTNLLVFAHNTTGVEEFHHGDCIGADSAAHRVAFTVMKRKPYIHPPVDDKFRAYNEPANLFEPKPYLERNAEILDYSDILIAMPKEDYSEGMTRWSIRRSGTWSTIRHALTRDMPVFIIWPHGTISTGRELL